MKLMRALIFSLALLVAVPCAHALSIRHTEARRLGASDIVRFANVFGQKLSHPTRIEVLSDPSYSGGLFFTAELSSSLRRIPAGSTAKVEVLFKDDLAPRTYNFAIPATRSHTHTIYFGITDAPFRGDFKDFPQLLAWKITILDAQGKAMATADSALWQF